MRAVDKDTLKYTDILELNENANAVQIADNVTCIYAYRFKKGISKKARNRFCNALKYSVENTKLYYSEEWFDFVEEGVFCLDKYKRIEEFKVLVMPEPTFTGKNTIMNKIDIMITDRGVTGFITFDRFKKLVECAAGKEPNEVDDLFKFECTRKETEALKAGTEILICTDLTISKSVVSEMVELIRSVNPKNKLTSFVFIDRDG